MYRNRTRNPDYDPNSNDRASGSLAGDHTHTRAAGGTTTDRLLHGRCNKERGDGTRDHLRPALNHNLNRQPDPTPTPPTLGNLAITCWP